MGSKTTIRVLQKDMETLAGIVSGRSCLTFASTDSVTSIIKAMHGHHQGAVGVIDAAGRFVGMITEREILRRLFRMAPETVEQTRFAGLEKTLPELTAGDVMIASPACLYTDMTIESGFEIITEHGFRFMPVVDRADKGKLSGIVSERELFLHVWTKTRHEIESRDSLLSYLMHHEDYGRGARI